MDSSRYSVPKKKASISATADTDTHTDTIPFYIIVTNQQMVAATRWLIAAWHCPLPQERRDWVPPAAVTCSASSRSANSIEVWIWRAERGLGRPAFQRLERGIRRVIDLWVWSRLGRWAGARWLRAGVLLELAVPSCHLGVIIGDHLVVLVSGRLLQSLFQHTNLLSLCFCDDLELCHTLLQKFVFFEYL